MQQTFVLIRYYDCARCKLFKAHYNQYTANYISIFIMGDNFLDSLPPLTLKPIQKVICSKSKQFVFTEAKSFLQKNSTKKGGKHEIVQLLPLKMYPFTYSYCIYPQYLENNSCQTLLTQIRMPQIRMLLRSSMTRTCTFS